jgi:TorA maturation chaperone TorD
MFSYPDESLMGPLRDGVVDRELAAAVDSLAEASGLWAALTALRTAWEGPTPVGPSLGEEYTYLFARNVRVALHASRYRDGGSVSSQDLAQIAGTYEAFGFRVAEQARELPDHLSVQLEFLAALCLKEAYALDQGWSGRASTARRARRKFVREHLEWFPRFEREVVEHARLPFYPAAAAWAQAVLAQDVGRAPRRPTQHSALSTQHSYPAGTLCGP